MRLGLNCACGATASMSQVVIVGISARWPATSRTRHPRHKDGAFHSAGLRDSSRSAMRRRIVRTADQ